jgi:hypothetical protein
MAGQSAITRAFRELKPSRGIPSFLAVMLASLLLIEVLGQVVGWEFTSEQRDFERMPIFYRQPIHNSVLDTHMNAQGSSCVGGTLAAALRTDAVAQ